jgi:hypothetical protein
MCLKRARDQCPEGCCGNWLCNDEVCLALLISGVTATILSIITEVVKLMSSPWQFAVLPLLLAVLLISLGLRMKKAALVSGGATASTHGGRSDEVRKARPASRKPTPTAEYIEVPVELNAPLEGPKGESTKQEGKENRIAETATSSARTFAATLNDDSDEDSTTSSFRLSHS